MNTTTTDTKPVADWKQNEISAALRAQAAQEALERQRQREAEEQAAAALAEWRKKFVQALLEVGVTDSEYAVSLAEPNYPTIYLDGIPFFSHGHRHEIYMPQSCIRCELVTNTRIHTSIDVGNVLLQRGDFLCDACKWQEKQDAKEQEQA